MNCIIIDDEPLAREEMLSLIKEVSDLEIIGSFSNTKLASEFLKNNNPDIIFLDIEMPLMNGLEFAENLYKNTLVIFTTAYSQYAIKSYEIDAIDYLLKPIDKKRLDKAINKAIVYKNLLTNYNLENEVEINSEEFIFIKADRKFYKIFFSDILYIEGLKDYVIIHTKNQKLITAMNLKTIHQKINSNLFLRVSKSYVVNTNFIDSFDNHKVYINKNEIPLGEVYKNDFILKYAKDILE
ncbi:LytTR family DNA-binding domain-containing protein [Chishuiella sp.]|uniref:LytR/AlgR family response regulator transcription factor n=1 Tax=Chishuiella sp. TaxID=1969467 RepID=UPI0028AD7092|nr:LytTR family DNA-binding domain-containing protein [Chishuiella sp.]